MRCPNCDNHILQKSGSVTKVRIRGRIVIENGKCTAQCYWCKSMVEVPLQIADEITVPSERFILSRNKS